MVKAAVRDGVVDERAAVLEITDIAQRAGADFIVDILGAGTDGMVEGVTVAAGPGQPGSRFARSRRDSCARDSNGWP